MPTPLPTPGYIITAEAVALSLDNATTQKDERHIVLEECERHLAEAKKARKKLETTVKDLTEETNKLKIDNKLLAESLRAQNKQFDKRTNALNRKSRELGGETKYLNDRNRCLEEKANKLEALNEALEKRTNALTAQNQELKEQYAQVKNENERITAYNVGLRNDINELQFTVASQTDQLDRMGRMMVEQNQRWERKLTDQEALWERRLVDQEARWEARIERVFQTRNDQGSWQQRSRSSSTSEQAM